MAKRRRRRNNNLPAIFTACAAIAVSVGVILAAVIMANKDDDVAPSSGQDMAANSPTSSAAVDTSSVLKPETSSGIVSSDEDVVRDHRLENGDYIEYTKSGQEELGEWYLRLANPWNSVGEDFEPENLVKAESVANGKIDARIYGAYQDMVNAAAEDGITIYGVSIYRTYNYQKNLFERRVADRMAEGMTRAEAEGLVATGTAVPGTSEHQLGLAVDFNMVETSFEDTEEGRWLRENCADYGFILRYPKGTTYKTGIIYEPWHFRFVGVKHAKRITELDMVLEEYVSYIGGGNE